MDISQSSNRFDYGKNSKLLKTIIYFMALNDINLKPVHHSSYFVPFIPFIQMIPFHSRVHSSIPSIPKFQASFFGSGFN